MVSLPKIFEPAQPFLDREAEIARKELDLPIVGLYAIDDYDYQDDRPVYSLQVVWPDNMDLRKISKDKPFMSKFAQWSTILELEFMDKFTDRWASTHLFSVSDWAKYLQTGSAV